MQMKISERQLHLRVWNSEVSSELGFISMVTVPVGQSSWMGSPWECMKLREKWSKDCRGPSFRSEEVIGEPAKRIEKKWQVKEGKTRTGK